MKKTSKKAQRKRPSHKPKVPSFIDLDLDGMKGRVSVLGERVTIGAPSVLLSLSPMAAGSLGLAILEASRIAGAVFGKRAMRTGNYDPHALEARAKPLPRITDPYSVVPGDLDSLEAGESDGLIAAAHAASRGTLVQGPMKMAARAKTSDVYMELEQRAVDKERAKRKPRKLSSTGRMSR